jgi:hypothetical protein
MKKIGFLVLLLVALSSSAQQTLIDENFTNGIPSAWTIVDGDGFTVHPSVSMFQPAWIGLEDPFQAGNFIAGSTSYFSPEAKAYRFLITPQIALGEYGNILSWRSMSHDPSFPDWIMVLVSTTGTEIEDFTDTLFRLNNEFPFWTERSVNLSDSGYVNQNIYLAFVNHTNMGFKLYLDDVKVDINDPVSTPSYTSSPIQIYPNPSTGMLYLASEEQIDEVAILDVSGKIVREVQQPNGQMDLSDLQAGLYYLRFTKGDMVETKIFQKL